MATQSYITFKVNGINMFYQTGIKDTVQVGSTLTTGIYGVWNVDGTNNLTVKNAWNANGDAIDSKSGANGTIATPSGTTFTTGSMTFGSGKLGSGAFTFNGSNFISLPANTFTFNSDYSVSFWCYIPSSVTSDSRYNSLGVPLVNAFDNTGGYTNYAGWSTSWYNNLFYFSSGGDVYGNSYSQRTVSMTLLNQWVHICVTRKYSTRSRIYINGTLVADNAITQNPTYKSNNLAYIGAKYYSFSTPYFSPTISGVKIDAVQTWDGTELDQTAVTELYNSGNGQEYPFTISNTLISTTNDAYGTNHGTRPSSTLSGGALGPTFTTGKIGNAFLFDGINDYIALADDSLNISGPISISFWIKSSNTSTSGIILGNIQSARGGYGFTHGYQIWLNLGKIQAGFRDGTTSTNYFVDSVASVSNNQWNNVIATYTPNSTTGIKVYINGTLDVSGQSPTQVNYSAPMKPCIGARSISNVVSTYVPLSNLDMLSIWNKTLTQSEVTELYNSGNGKQYPY